jgi:hypothetical protein
LETNDLIRRRLEELEEIKKLGINPYPHRFDVNAVSKQKPKSKNKKLFLLPEGLWVSAGWGKPPFAISRMKPEGYRFISGRMMSAKLCTRF